MVDLSNENIIHIKDGNLEYIQCRKLLEYNDKIAHCFSMRNGNIDYREDNGKNYKELYESIGLDLNKKVRIEKQSHTDLIENVYKENENHMYIDGLITDAKGISLMLRYADCTAILLYDTKKEVVANIHSGWKGTVQKIGQKAVLKMIKDYNSNPKDIICFLAPAIGKCHFKVDVDVKEIFEREFSHLNINDKIIFKGEIEEGKQKYYIDTNLINRVILEEVGLRKENIVESGICTVCNSKYFHSYRVDKEKSGRNVAIIGRR